MDDKRTPAINVKMPKIITATRSEKSKYNIN